MSDKYEVTIKRVPEASGCLIVVIAGLLSIGLLAGTVCAMF